MNRRVAWLAALLAGCSQSGNRQEQDADQGVPSIAAQQRQTSVEFTYGVHYPNGQAAVNYILGPEGMWKQVDVVEQNWSFYAHCATPDRPLDRNALLAAANGSRFFTAADADCNVLWDTDRDGQAQLAGTAHAFHEHNGRGVQGQQLTTPFTLFWFDDNWLARYMTHAYGEAPPDGLSEAQRIRWRILGGTVAEWKPYGDEHFDRLALDGVYYLAGDDVASALEQWRHIRDRSGYYFDDATRRFVYPTIDENYHLALFGILTSLLLDRVGTSGSDGDELLQHWVSVRSNILSNQERNAGELLGWRSSISDVGSLMNTETISLAVLALGAGAIDVFEAGQAPLHFDSRGYVRTQDNVLSAVAGLSQAGYMTLGPAVSYPAGRYQVQYFLRSPATAGSLGRLEIIDSTRSALLVQRQVRATDLSPRRWTRIDVEIELTQAQGVLEFRTYWDGAANLDLAALRIRKL